MDVHSRLHAANVAMPRAVRASYAYGDVLSSTRKCRDTFWITAVVRSVAATLVSGRAADTMARMDTVLAAVVAWWKIEAGVAGGMMVLVVLWRWLLADFVLERVGLP
jgi:hypothetical protein